MSSYRKTMSEAYNSIYLVEDNVAVLRNIVKRKQMMPIKFADGSMKVDLFTASAVTQALDKVNDKNREKITKLINTGKKSAFVSIAKVVMKSENDPEIEEELDLDEAVKVGDNVKVKLSRKGKEYIEKGKVIKIEGDSIIVKHDFSRTPSKIKMTDIVKEELELDEKKLEDSTPDELRALLNTANKLLRTNKGNATVIKRIGQIKKLMRAEEVDFDEARQLKNPKKEVMVVKSGKVIVIDKKDAKEYLNKGWDLAEDVDLDEATKWKMGDGKPRGGSNIENVRFWDLPKDELRYIIKDAGEAYKLNPTARKATKGPGNWADQVNDATTVLGWRKKKGIKEDVDLDEGSTTIFKKGDKIKVPHKGKLRDGKVVRYVPQRGSASPYYVVYVDEYQSIEVPEYKVKQHNEEVDLDEGTWAFPKTSKEKAALKKLLSKPLKAKDAADKLYDIIGNDDLADDIGDFADKHPNDDVREIVRSHMKRLGIKEEVGFDEGKMKELSMKIDAVYAKMKKHRDMKGFADKFKKDVAKSMNISKSLEKVLPDYISGKELAGLQSEEVGFDEASARADAMRAMGKGKSVDPADVDDTATDDDVKAASKNIMMQLRKAISLRGDMKVEFGDKKKVKVSPKIAAAAATKYNSLRRPADKEKFQAQIAKSYKDLLKGIKENVVKESKFSFINKQLKGEK